MEPLDVSEAANALEYFVTQSAFYHDLGIPFRLGSVEFRQPLPWFYTWAFASRSETARIKQQLFSGVYLFYVGAAFDNVRKDVMDRYYKHVVYNRYRLAQVDAVKSLEQLNTLRFYHGSSFARRFQELAPTLYKVVETHTIRHDLRKMASVSPTLYETGTLTCAYLSSTNFGRGRIVLPVVPEMWEAIASMEQELVAASSTQPVEKTTVTSSSRYSFNDLKKGGLPSRATLMEMRRQEVERIQPRLVIHRDAHGDVNFVEEED